MTPPDTLAVQLKPRYTLFKQPHIEHERIASTLIAYEQELTANVALTNDQQLYTTIKDLLHKAIRATNDHIYDQAWKLFHSAKRLEVKTYSLSQLRTELVKLNKEAAKATQWRKEAVELLVNIPPEDIVDGNIDMIREKVMEAMFLLHDHYDNVYLRLNRRKRQIAVVSLLLGIAVIVYIICNIEHEETLRIAILGVLGSLFSTAVTLTSSSVNKKIPDQVLGAWIVFLRPFIGATSAIVAMILLESEIITILGGRDGVLEVAAFAAGFSERYTINALGSILKPESTNGDGA